MNLSMDLLGNPLTTRPIEMGWDITIDPYPTWWSGNIYNPDRQFGHISISTRTRTRSHGP